MTPTSRGGIRMLSGHRETRDTDQAADPASSLPVALSTIAMIALVGLGCGLAKVPGTAVEPIIGISAALPTTMVLAVRRFRASPTSRAIAVARDGLIANPITVALLLGSIALLVDSFIGMIIGAVAGATSGAVLNIGGSGAAAQYLFKIGYDSGSLIYGIPMFFVSMVFIGRRAGHYLHGKKFWWLLFVGGSYLALKAIVLLSAGDLVGVNRGQAMLISVFGALITTLTAWLGALWARRSQDVFVGARLLAQLPIVDRQAALDLLRESVTSKEKSANLGKEPAFSALSGFGRRAFRLFRVFRGVGATARGSSPVSGTSSVSGTCDAAGGSTGATGRTA